MADTHLLPAVEYSAAKLRCAVADIVKLSVAGHPIIVGSDADFITLYHAFERTSHRDTHRLVRKRQMDGASVVIARCSWTTSGVN